MIESIEELDNFVKETLTSMLDDKSITRSAIENFYDNKEKELKEKFGLSLLEMKEALSNFVIQNADELATEFVNIAPFEDYSKLLENPESISEFLKSEAHKVEHWKTSSYEQTYDNKKIITFNFYNDAVDDGNSFNGFAYVSFDGVIKHVSAHGQD